jgi:hypothetical protein
MHTRLPAALVTLIPLVLAPISVLAETCGDYPLTQEQADYLQNNVPDIAIPDGTVPTIQRCDVNGDNVVNNDDLFAIRENRGQAAVHPDDPMDWDGNGIIHGRDVGGCASSCSNNSCAVKSEEEEEGLQSAQVEELMGGKTEAASCFQIEDFDGDGSQDFVGIYEHTGSDVRANGWVLDTVILTEDSMGNVQHITFPFTGRSSNGGGDLLQHLSPQLPGVIDLMPGSVTISGPGVVSYRGGLPEELIYFDENGDLARAFYRVDD